MVKEKRNIIFLFIIILILALVTNNAFISMFLYNQNFNINTSEFILQGYGINEKLLVGILFLYEFIFIITGFICYIYFKIYAKLVKSKVAQIENENERKKIGNSLLSLVFITFIIFDTLIYVNANKYIEDSLNQINIWSQNYFLEDVYKTTANISYYQQFPEIKSWAFIVLIISLMPTGLVFRKLFLGQEKTIDKITYRLSNGLLAFSIVIFISVNVYYYIDIPSFKYYYDIYENEVCVFGYSDNRDMLYQQEFIIPEKIAGKNVTNIQDYTLLNPDKKIIIPNSIKWDIISNEEETYLFSVYNNEIEMKGQPIEWYIEDKIAYNIEKTEMFLMHKNTEKIIVSDKIEKIGNIEYITLFMKDVDIEVSKNNSHFLEWNNVIYEIKKEMNSNDNLTEEFLYGVMPKNQKSIKIMDDPLSKIVIFGVNEKGSKIILPNTMKKGFNCATIAIVNDKTSENNYEFVVEEGNMFFTYEEGILYDKEKTTIINIIPKVYDSEKIIILETVKDINPEIIKECKNKRISIEVTENNPYIESIENGEIKYKVGKEI